MFLLQNMLLIMNKTALITGASAGIGLELARIHAAKGDDLILVARTGSKLETLKTDLEKNFNIKVHIIIKDLTLNNACREIYDEVRSKGLSVTYLINNAGFGDFGYFAESDWEKQERMINLNITALAHLTRLILPDMIAMGEGKIMNVASLAAFQPGPSMSVYFATKAFVLSFSEAVNNEVSDKGISVTALCPGPVETNFHAVVMDDPELVSNRKMATAKEVAEYGYRSMIKGKPVAIPGFKTSLMAFAIRFLPREFIVRMVRKIQEKKHSREI
jgi:short-subunit dehydrogenase